MKLFVFILSMFMITAFSSCKDGNTGVTEESSMYTEDHIPDMSGVISEEAQETQQNPVLTPTQKKQLHEALNLSEDQTQKLNELEQNGAITNESQMDTSYKSVLDDEQYANYQAWKKENLKQAMNESPE